MLHLDNIIAQELKSDIEDSVFADEYGEFIDTLADLKTDADIVNDCLGGYKNE